MKSIKYWKEYFLLFFVLFGLGFASANGKAQSVDNSNNLYLPIILNNADFAWQWENGEFITLPNYPVHGPFLKIDSSSKIHLFWDVMTTGNQFIFTTRKSAEGWTPVEKIDNTLGASSITESPELGSNGNVLLIWNNQLTTGGPYRLMFDSFTGSTWEVAEEIVRDNSQLRFAAINRGENDSVNVAYGISNMIATQYYFSQKTKSGWSSAQLINPDLPYPYSINRVFPDQHGGVKYLIRSWVNQTMYYSYWKNGQFTQNLIPLGIINPFANSILDSQDNWHFYDTVSVPVSGGSVTGLYHQCLSSDLGLGSEQVLTGSLPLSSYSVTRDEGGKVVLSWTDSQHGNSLLHLEIFQGCDLVDQREFNLPVLQQPYTWGALVSSSKTSGLSGRYCALFKKSFGTEYGLFCARTID